MELTLLWLQLAAAAGIILVTAHFMAGAADVIAEKTGLGRSFVGVVMLATATSLPELGTGVSSIVLVGEVDLAAGDAFGSNLFNLLIIGLLDIYWRRGPILSSVTPTSALVGILGILVISVALIAMVVHGLTESASTWLNSPLSLILFGVFLVAMFLIYRAGNIERDLTVTSDKVGNYAGRSLTRAFITYLVTAAVVVAAGVWLANIGENLAHTMGWEASFVGTQFLALSTSLPEIAASFAALRLGAPELAITNVLGSNLFNMGFVLFLDDVAFTEGVIWSGISQIHQLTAIMAIIMTAIVVVGIMTRAWRRPRLPVSPEGASMIVLYIIVSVLVFGLA
ncbi:MAG: hypothetical protein OXC95_01665 [Dehalococcoidia bacterium]|nr:hypothetical protein [Dehalococcoidia bacterium]